MDIYIHLIDHEINQSVNRENEIAAKVAFYFPGVMHTLGGSKWDSMKKLFNRLLFFKSNVLLLLFRKLRCQSLRVFMRSVE